MSWAWKGTFHSLTFCCLELRSLGHTSLPGYWEMSSHVPGRKAMELVHCSPVCRLSAPCGSLSQLFFYLTSPESWVYIPKVPFTCDSCVMWRSCSSSDESVWLCVEHFCSVCCFDFESHAGTALLTLLWLKACVLGQARQAPSTSGQ